MQSSDSHAAIMILAVELLRNTKGWREHVVPRLEKGEDASAIALLDPAFNACWATAARLFETRPVTP